MQGGKIAIFGASHKYTIHMKTTFLLLGLFLALHLSAQTPDTDPPPLAANFSVWSQRLDMSAYVGKKYRLQAAIRAEIGADSSAALVFIRNEYPEGGFQKWTYMDNMRNRQVRHRDWKTYTLESTVDQRAPFVGFGCNAFGAGNFYYDDLQLSVEAEPGKWKNIPIPNGNFEQKNLDPWLQTQLGVRFTAKDAYATLDKKGAFEGKQCLHIENKFIPYGSNPAAARYFDVNGIRLYAEIYGEGPALVLLPTNGGAIMSSAALIPDLAKKFRVIAFDTRGQGKSTNNGTALSHAQIADDILKGLNQMGVDSACFIGYGDGAVQAMHLALANPKLVKRILAASTCILVDSTAIYPIILAGIDKLILNTTDPKELESLKFNKEPTGISTTLLKKIQCPVLLITGDRDWVKPEHTLQMFKAIPRAQLCIVPGTTTNFAIEKSDLFLQLAFEFFNKPFETPDTQDWFRE